MGKPKKFYETNDFKKAKAQWYGLLKETGFADIEEGEDETVIRPQVITGTEVKKQYQGGLDYYQLCQSIIRDYKFKKEVHRTIFELHAEGKSERDIVTWLHANTTLTYSQKGINKIIHRIKLEFDKV